MITEDIDIIVTFTEAEIGNLGREMSQAVADARQLKKDSEQVAASYKARLKKAEADIDLYQGKIAHGSEMRRVRCIMLDHRPVEGKRIIIRTDNGHVYRIRKLEPEERQMQLIVGDVIDFHLIALLVVDDKHHDAEFIQVPLYKNEWDEIANATPPIITKPWLKAIAAQAPVTEEPTLKAERIKKKD